ncbi:hypothetical protein ONZ45_g18597 [Pleurotus djamor]|nr:hypothetical protein ONZ45_g18597 [Pleurotus djamor]
MMTPETSSADSTPRLNRVKRKPAPTFDLREKYPELDPADPFAPLSVLRTRSSGAAFQLGSHDNLASQSTSQQLPAEIIVEC